MTGARRLFAASAVAVHNGELICQTMVVDFFNNQYEAEDAAVNKLASFVVGRDGHWKFTRMSQQIGDNLISEADRDINEAIYDSLVASAEEEDELDDEDEDDLDLSDQAHYFGCMGDPDPKEKVDGGCLGNPLPDGFDPEDAELLNDDSLNKDEDEVEVEVLIPNEWVK